MEWIMIACFAFLNYTLCKSSDNNSKSVSFTTTDQYQCIIHFCCYLSLSTESMLTFNNINILILINTGSLFFVTTIIYNFQLLLCVACVQSTYWAVWWASWLETAVDGCQIKNMFLDCSSSYDTTDLECVCFRIKVMVLYNSLRYATVSLECLCVFFGNLSSIITLWQCKEQVDLFFLW